MEAVWGPYNGRVGALVTEMSRTSIAFFSRIQIEAADNWDGAECLILPAFSPATLMAGFRGACSWGAEGWGKPELL